MNPPQIYIIPNHELQQFLICLILPGRKRCLRGSRWFLYNHLRQCISRGFVCKRKHESSASVAWEIAQLQSIRYFKKIKQTKFSNHKSPGIKCLEETSDPKEQSTHKSPQANSTYASYSNVVAHRPSDYRSPGSPPKIPPSWKPIV